MKELPAAGVTLTAEAAGAARAAGTEGFGSGADGFFSSGGDTLKYKMPR